MPTAVLDHVVINARDDLDEACAVYRRLGFHLTERGYHNFGSMNHLAIFGSDYLELIALPRGGATARRDLLDFPSGLNGLVFATEDSDSASRSLTERGAPFDLPVEFSRPVEVSGAQEAARFRGIFMKPGVVPYGRVYFCHHLTRNFVWRDEWRDHPNGVVSVQRMLIVEPEPAVAAQLYSRMFGDNAVVDCEGGKSVIAGNARVDIVTDAAFRRAFGETATDPQGRGAYMAGLTLRTTSLQRLVGLLRGNGIGDVSQRGGSLIVPARHALNTTLEFIE